MKKQFICKKLAALLIAVMLSLLPSFSLTVFADTYVGESTPCNTISYLSSAGYHIGGANVNTGATPDYYLQYRTYTASEGSSNAKVYNETSPTSTNYISNSNNQYWYYWDCPVKVSEHSNQYGYYTTDVYRVLSDGTTKFYTTATTYVSPISLPYTYAITSSQSVAVVVTPSDVFGSMIEDMKYASGKQSLAYFDNFSNSYIELQKNVDGTWTANIPVGGQYTLYAKDSSGYGCVVTITIKGAGSNVHTGITQASTMASTTPTVNSYAWAVQDINVSNMSVSGNAISSNQSISDSTAPQQNSTTNLISFTSDNTTHNVTYRIAGVDFNQGDEFFASAWVKITDTIHSHSVGTNGIWTPSWQGVPDSQISGYNYVPADGNWHFIYSLVRINFGISSTILQPFSASGTGLTSVEVNGVHCIKIPNGSSISDGLQSSKWAYGQQPVSYFDSGNGTTYSGSAFQVFQNGYVTAWAKNVSGQEQMQTYDVENYDPYAGDNTPPTGSYNLSTSAWTTGNVTINVTATDTQSGVKSITLPNGTVANGNTCSYTVSNNGTYTFALTDNAGNTCTYPVTVSNIDRQVNVSYTSSASYTVDPNNLSSPLSGGEITLTNNNTHIGAKVTLQSLASVLTGTNGFALGTQVEESASGNTTWSEIDNKSVQLAGGGSTVLGVLSPGVPVTSSWWASSVV